MASFGQVQTPSLVDSAYEAVRRAILVGDVEPGSRLAEAVVAREMGISRAPVREALRMLERSGLVNQQHNKGYRVSEFTDDDFFELATLRFALESLAMRLAIKSENLVPNLESVLYEIRDAERSGDQVKAVMLDRQFHEVIVIASGHGRLREIWTGLRDQIELAVANTNRSFATLEGLSHAHVPLLKAIRGGDLEHVVKELEIHIFNGPLIKKEFNATN
jgi:DNA-binding GntR family transcriptional regulator